MREAREQSPEILAARRRWEAAQKKVLAVKTWPDPQVGVEYWGFSRGRLNVGDAEEKWYDVSQTVPFPGKLTLRGRAAHHEANRQEGNFRAVEREVLARVKSAYYDLLFAHRALAVVEEQVSVMRRIARIAEARYAAGKVSQSEVLRTEVELSKILNMRVTLEQEKETAQARLNALLNRPTNALLGIPEGPPLAPFRYTAQQLEELALQFRPELDAARHHVDHMRSELAATRAEYLPDTMLQYTFRERRGMPNDAVAMVRVNVPFVWFWRQGALVGSASRERDEARAMLHTVENMTRYEIKDLWVKVQTARRLVDLYRTSVLPQAEQSVKVAEALYRANRAGFLDLLDSVRSILEFQMGYAQSLAQYGQHLAQLERAIGKDL
ncbi:MAG: TolC family protein [Elusimicrobia bacterium]|nr:TolC family protein [Elusimicrobiota bacterium]